MLRKVTVTGLYLIISMIVVIELSGTCHFEYSDTTYMNIEIKTEFYLFELSLN
jgi:hypothetical protein